MKSVFILTFMIATASAYSAEKKVSYTEPAQQTQSAQISYSIQSENETEVVIVNSKIEFNSKTYNLYGGLGTGYTLCKALGFQDGQQTLVQRFEEDPTPEVIMINMQGSISIIRNPIVLHTTICFK